MSNFDAATVKVDPSSEDDKKVPITVITGFLGSGKTTLLNHILSADHGLKIAVIENEFGEIGIDDSLVKKRINADEEIFEMNNGCICCTVRGDLIRILGRLLSATRKVDAVIIETTGMADPAPVAQTFFVDEEVQAKARLDGILTVVDAKHIVQHLDEIKPEGAENEAVEQVVFADKLLLNKIDLIDDAERTAVEGRLRTINKAAPIVPCQLNAASLPLTELLGIRAFDLKRVLEMEPEFLSPDAEHVHDASITSVGINEVGDLDMKKINDWIGTLLREKGVDIYRMKGVLSIADSKQKFVFQGVHMLFTGEPLEEWKEGEERKSKLVFIGKKLDREELLSGFKACIV